MWPVWLLVTPAMATGWDYGWQPMDCWGGNGAPSMEPPQEGNQIQFVTTLEGYLSVLHPFLGVLYIYI